METQVLCLPEEFITKSNEIVQHPIERGCHSVSSTYREHAISEREAGNEALANALELASNICSMMLVPESINEPFKPFIQMEGKRSAIADDFTMEELKFIDSVYSYIEEPLVKARFADLLWLCAQPRKIDHARTAIKSYLSLPIEPKRWHSDLSACWKRCVRLALSINYRSSISTIESSLLAAFSKDYPDNAYMHLWIAEIITENGMCGDRLEPIAVQLFRKAESFYSKAQYREAREYLHLSEKLFKSLNNDESWLGCLVLSANSFEHEGDARLGSSQGVANSFYENALQAYRRIPAAKREELGVTEKLESIRKKITNTGSGVMEELRVMQGPSTDISDLVVAARKHVSDKESLEVALLFFSGFSGPKYQDLHARTLDLIKAYPISNLFARNQYASDGRLVAKTPAMSLDEPSSDHKAVFHKMIQNFQHDLQLIVQAQIIPALNQILMEYRVTKEFLRLLCYHSPIVPESHDDLMASALWCGFEHDFGNGIHLLAPQVEHLIRTLLKSKGVHTSNVDKEWVENENGLSTLLDHPRSESILGEDLLFELKAVLTESVGPNLRNEVAHGLLNDSNSHSSASVYCWWLVLRLVIKSLYGAGKS